jgi:hypothetical protein
MIICTVYDVRISNARASTIAHDVKKIIYRLINRPQNRGIVLHGSLSLKPTSAILQSTVVESFFSISRLRRQPPINGFQSSVHNPNERKTIAENDKTWENYLVPIALSYHDSLYAPRTTTDRLASTIDESASRPRTHLIQSIVPAYKQSYPYSPTQHRTSLGASGLPRRHESGHKRQTNRVFR